MRVPLEYGDNFPVPSWDPSVPWRFPRHEVRLKGPSRFSRIFPWLMLGVGVTLGALWMSWQPQDSVPSKDSQLIQSLPNGRSGTAVAPETPLLPPDPVEVAPKGRPASRTRTGLA